MTQNVTKEGILVLPGQVWVDLDPRMHNRKVTILTVENGKAEYQGIRRGVLSIDRMHRANRWALHKQAEGAMPLAEVQQQYCLRKKGSEEYLRGFPEAFCAFKEALFFKEHELPIVKERVIYHGKRDLWEIVMVTVKVEPLGVLHW